jgi:hypothetical protein
MANLLQIEKLDNGVFSFVLNGDLATKVSNIRNDLLTVGNECHFKTSQGANIIKEQSVTYDNVTLKDGVTLIIPTSVVDLFDELFALGYFDWINGTGSGVDRFTDLLDTFDFTNQGGKMVVVNAAETQLEPTEFSLLTQSTQLSDMPATLEPNKMLIVNPTGNGYILIDKPAGAISYYNEYTYVSPNPQTFSLTNGSSVIMLLLNGTPIKKNTDWTQSGNLLTINPTVTLSNDDLIEALGVI